MHPAFKALLVGSFQNLLFPPLWTVDSPQSWAFAHTVRKLRDAH